MHLFSSSLSLLLLSIFTLLRPSHAERTEFPASPATCANANADLPYVIVQPVCDLAISAICNVTVALNANLTSLDRYRAVTDVGPGSCEAQIIFPEPRPTFIWDSGVCVKAFQDITINCMLLRRKWSAPVGQQAGISGVVFDEELGFSALNTAGPGYLVGPPNYYGDIGAEDLSAFVPGNRLPTTCQNVNGTRVCNFRPPSISLPPGEEYSAIMDADKPTMATSTAVGT